MKRAFIILACSALLSGCTVVSIQSAYNGCRLIDIAHREADLAPGWYEKAGAVLEECGVADARERTVDAVCSAQKRNGYECEARE